MEKSNSTILREYGITILIAVGIAFLIRTYCIEAYRIPSSTMTPTLLPGDVIFAGKWDQWMKKTPLPERGEVIVYSDRDENDSSIDYIKRVLALPGDRISLKDGTLFIHKTVGQKSGQTPLTPVNAENFGPIILSSNSVFVIGDSKCSPDKNADPKSNKKCWDIIPVSAIKGKALWIWLSIDSQPVGTPIAGTNTSRWFPHLRMDRMFRRIQ